MLTSRIIFTLKFFDLQDLPLTLIELYVFLLSDPVEIKQAVNENWDITQDMQPSTLVTIDELLTCLEHDCKDEVTCEKGFYCLRGREALIDKRLDNYMYGIQRERLIRKFIGGLRYLPFIRGVALAGSQAFGQQKLQSDIDLLIITEPGFLWLGRTLVTGYFQIIGKRRHGAAIANRFCLNHYIAAPKEVVEYKNLYTASEYIKLRPLIFSDVVRRFQFNNKQWITSLFPNVEFLKIGAERQSSMQAWLEKIFTNRFGFWLEKKLKSWQLPKIRTDEKFIVVKDDELSFHPMSKQQHLLQKFFQTLT